MTLQRSFRELEIMVEQWLSDLTLYSDEQLLRKPDDRQWSIGQVYIHLIQSAENFHLKQVELCATGKGETVSGGKTMPGRITYFLGVIPPVRVSVPPSEFYTPKQPVNKEEIRTRMRGMLEKVRLALPMAQNAPRGMKLKHPGFGYLDGREWFQLITMHYRHHRRQQKRLNTFLWITA